MLSNSSGFTEIRPVTKEFMTAATFSVKNPKTAGIDNFQRFRRTVPSGNSFIWHLATFRNCPSGFLNPLTLTKMSKKKPSVKVFK
jgi:hypothetical protein